MKKLILFSIVLLFALTSNAQTKKDETPKDPPAWCKTNGDHLTYTFWKGGSYTFEVIVLENVPPSYTIVIERNGNHDKSKKSFHQGDKWTWDISAGDQIVLWHNDNGDNPELSSRVTIEKDANNGYDVDDRLKGNNLIWLDYKRMFKTAIHIIKNNP